MNPMNVKSGDIIYTGNGNKTRKVVSSTECPSKPECWHLDNECYDVRFSNVTVKP